MSNKVRSVSTSIILDKPNPFTGASVEDDQPISYPLDSIEELFQWKPNDPNDHGQLFSVARVPHRPKVIKDGSLKTLVCDDNANGYHADRFVQGKSNEDAYHMRYLNMVDIFVYFSHHFITVPTVSWINAAHRNGVTILGTFITESESGYQKCAKIFSSEKSWRRVADQLIELAQFYRFDGWFLNIENSINVKFVPALIDFIRYLTDKMHEVDTNALVLWYDAVTCTGNLSYQNELNENNKCFYEVCDGIFLNYSWTEKGLEVSKSLARSGSSVFVGVDVFGRSSSSAGGFQTDLAMKKIQSSGLSSGIFAPAWDYQKFGAKHFEENDRKFWKKLQPYCASYPLDSDGVYSRFNPGDYPDKWCFINAQDLMPLLPSPYLSVVTEKEVRIGKLNVNIPKSFSESDNLISIFKFQMYFEKNQTVSLIFPEDCSCKFVLLSDSGVIISSLTIKRRLSFDQIVKEAIFENTVQATVVHGLAIEVRDKDKSCDFTIDFLHFIPSSSSEYLEHPSFFSCKCIDIFWKKRNETSLYFSSTLVFDDLSSNVASSDVQCRIDCGENHVCQFVGSSHCDRFRVHDLVVPYPQTSAEGSILFIISHLSNAGLKFAESQIKIVYRRPTSICCALQ